MVTYQERKSNLHHYVLMIDCEVQGTFSSLKGLCEFVDDPKFPSYWTLIRKKADVMEFGKYKIQKVKHHMTDAPRTNKNQTTKD